MEQKNATEEFSGMLSLCCDVSQEYTTQHVSSLVILTYVNLF